MTKNWAERDCGYRQPATIALFGKVRRENHPKGGAILVPSPSNLLKKKWCAVSKFHENDRDDDPKGRLKATVRALKVLGACTA